MRLGCSSVGSASDRHSPEAASIPQCSKGSFSPGVNFQCRLSCGVRTPPCAIACINICVHVKDPVVVHVRARWIMETLQHAACTVGRVARDTLSRITQSQPPSQVTCFPRKSRRPDGGEGVGGGGPSCSPHPKRCSIPARCIVRQAISRSLISFFCRV